MGQRLNDKLPRVTIPSERITEVHWQQLLPGGNFDRKSIQAASGRHNTVILIGEGDHSN